MEVYQFLFYFDYGSGSCLWPANEATSKKWGEGAIDIEQLQLSSSIKERIKNLDGEFYSSRNPPQKPHSS